MTPPHSPEITRVRFHPQVQYVTGGPWIRPSVGNIEDGYATAAEVEELFRMLRLHDGDYYGRARFRVVKRTEEVVSRPGVQ